MCSEWSQSWWMRECLRWEGLVKEVFFEPEVKERGRYGWWEWWIDDWLGNLCIRRRESVTVRLVRSCLRELGSWFQRQDEAWPVETCFVTDPVSEEHNKIGRIRPAVCYQMHFLHLWTNWPSVRVAEYCDKRVCVFVCLCVWLSDDSRRDTYFGKHEHSALWLVKMRRHRKTLTYLHISEATHPNYAKFSLHAVYGCRLVLLWRWNRSCTSGFVDEVRFLPRDAMHPRY